MTAKRQINNQKFDVAALVHMNELAIWQWGERGWKWVEKSNGFGSTFRTDGNGQGLFHLDIRPDGTETWFQRLGTCQYNVPADRDRAITAIGADIATLAELETLPGNF